MASLMPPGKQQYFAADGSPLAGGKLYTYAAGTSTPQVTYSDKFESIPNTNPVILDSRGEASIFWGQDGYKAVLKDAADSIIWTVDKLYAVQDTTSMVFPQEVITATGGQTVFELGIKYNVGGSALAIYRNGIRLFPGDYTENTPTRITLTTPASAADKFLFISAQPFGTFLDDVLVAYLGPYAGNITIVGSNITDVNTVATNITAMGTVATNIADVNVVGLNMPAVLAVIDNLVDINAAPANVEIAKDAAAYLSTYIDSVIMNVQFPLDLGLIVDPVAPYNTFDLGAI